MGTDAWPSFRVCSKQQNDEVDERKNGGGGDGIGEVGPVELCSDDGDRQPSAPGFRRSGVRRAGGRRAGQPQRRIK